MQIRAIFLFILLPFAMTAQLSPAVNGVYERLKSDADFAGTTASPKAQVIIDNKFRSLAGIATDAEVFHVALSGGSALRECALAELVDRKSDNLNALFSHYLNDDDSHEVFITGKLTRTTTAAQLFRRVAWQKEKRLRKEYYERTANSSEIVELKVLFGRDFSTRWTVHEADSLMQSMMSEAMLADDIPVETLNAILKTTDYKTDNYSRIKFFAEKYRTPEILAALATYQNRNDLPFLKQNIDNGYLAITRFPDASFLPELRSRLAKNFDDPHYQDAVASFKSSEARNLLEAMIRQIAANNSDDALRSEKMLRLYNIIERKNCQLFQPVLAKLEYY